MESSPGLFCFIMNAEYLRIRYIRIYFLRVCVLSIL